MGVDVLVVVFFASIGVVDTTTAADVGVASFVDDFYFVVAATMRFFIGI